MAGFYAYEMSTDGRIVPLYVLDGYIGPTLGAMPRTFRNPSTSHSSAAQSLQAPSPGRFNSRNRYALAPAANIAAPAYIPAYPLPNFVPLLPLAPPPVIPPPQPQPAVYYRYLEAEAQAMRIAGDNLEAFGFPRHANTRRFQQPETPQAHRRVQFQRTATASAHPNTIATPSTRRLAPLMGPLSWGTHAMQTPLAAGRVWDGNLGRLGRSGNSTRAAHTTGSVHTGQRAGAEANASAQTKAEQTAQRDAPDTDVTCPICRDRDVNLEIVHCKHRFCEDCITKYRRAAEREPTCPLCRGPLGVFGSTVRI